MSFAARLIHDLTIIRSTFGADDAYGQPAPTYGETAVKGLVQPRAVREVEDSRSANAQVGDHVVFLGPDTDLEGADAIIWHLPDLANPRLNVTGIRRYAFGTSPHLEVDCNLVIAATVGTGS